MKKKFSIVMPVYKTKRFLARAIDSLIDQDYKEWELICVMDGRDDECEKILKKYADKDARIGYDAIVHKGVCAARNHGLDIATGDYITFFSSDFKALPGMLRTWLDAFEDNPSCGFVYGGYKLLADSYKDPEETYFSQEFDPYMLEVSNYIDGGFPIKKELCPRWDENIKSLNDWDFWLQVVRNGIKGHYIKDITYGAEKPRPGGLSHDSHSNWIQRTNYIKKKHGIIDRQICVSSLGAPFHGIKAAKVLNADFKVMPSSKPHKYKAIYLLGFYITSADKHALVFQNTNGAKKIIHWIGSDIELLKEAKWKDTTALVDVFRRSGFINLCEFKQTQKELKEIGIDASIVPLSVENKFKNIPPLPDRFTIGVYAPLGAMAEKKYNLTFMADITKAMPDVNFLFFGGITAKVKNVESIAHSPIESIIPRCSMLLRFTNHDGLPISPIEFAMAGRDVLLTTTLPFMDYISPYMQESYSHKKAELIEKIRMIQKRKISKKKRMDAKKYWESLCSPEAYKRKINKLVFNK